MVDKVRALKIENSDSGGTQIDFFPTESNPNEDYLSTKGVSFENSDIEKIDLSLDTNLQATSIASIILTKTLVDEVKVYKISNEHQYICYDYLQIDGTLQIDGDVIVFN